MTPPSETYHQISDTDLCSLEELLPKLLSRDYANLDDDKRAMWNRVRRIIGDVRWNYGPPTQVETINDGECDI